ncbi:MAG: tetratricopeptide repeat protein [Chloroflexota bacterium]|nr:tetratricopeptide repeat protein [Chloroflexota bacterium]
MLPAEILTDADAALTAGEAARGLHLVDHLLRTFPGHLRARTLRAQMLLELGDEDAAADAATVLSADLLNVDALLVSARLAEAQGDLHQSHALIGRAASIEPGHAGVRRAFADSVMMLPRDAAALGLSYLAHGWPDLAERELRAALARDSSRADLRVGLAEALWQQGRYEEARPECRTVLDHNPDCLRATLMMAHILAEQGRTAHGVEMLEQARELDPEFTIAAEMYAKATLSRMSLPPPPSVPEPPPYVDAAATATDEGEQEGIFTPVPDPDAGAAEEGAETPADPEEDAAKEDDEVVADAAPVEEDAESTGDDETVAEPTAAAGSAASFSAGWPAAAPEGLEATDPADGGPGTEAAPSEVRPEPEPPVADGPAATDFGDEVDAAEVEIEASVESSVEGVAGMPGGEKDRPDEGPEPATENESPTETASAEPEAEPELVAEPDPESSAETVSSGAETAIIEPGPEPEPEPPDDDGRAALIGMARLGGWDSVLDTLAERLAGEELGEMAAIIEELDQLDGFPIEIWRLLGDHYMRNRRPQLASEAYFRAVRWSS